MRQMAFVSPFQSPFVKPFPSEAVVAAAFDPLTLSPSLWFAGRDATTLYTDAGITLVSADGNAVYQANDKSGNGRNAVQTTLAYRPTYKTNIKNGLSVARGSTASGFVLSSNLTLSTFTLFFVAKRSNAGGNDTILGDSVTGAYGIFILGNTLHYRTSSGLTSTSIGWNDTNWQIGAMVKNGSSLFAYRNGVDVTSGTPTNSTNITASGFLARNDGTTAGFFGDAGEVIVFPSALSAGDMTNMWTYLNTLWAVY